MHLQEIRILVFDYGSVLLLNYIIDDYLVLGNNQLRKAMHYLNKKRWLISKPPFQNFNLFYFAKSNLSRFITLSQAATKSCTNFSFP